MLRAILLFSWIFLFNTPALCFSVQGVVKSLVSGQPIPGVAIYELYKEHPVAKTDNNGIFKYETESDSPVEIHVEKAGYRTASALSQRVYKDNKPEQLEFVLQEWFEKAEPVKFYVVLNNNKNCKLNLEVTISRDVKDAANNYDPVNLNPNKHDGELLLYPNPDGAIIIPNLTPDITVYSKLATKTPFFQAPETDTFYIDIPQEQIDNWINGQVKSFFNLKKGMGLAKRYNDFDDYKVDFIKNLYKFCPDKLNEIQQSESHNEPGEIDNQEENAKKMKEKEQSMENKLLGAAGMGLTGTGLMQSMSAGAEQKADEMAELDMNAYLATMHCNYAPGKNVQGGEKAVELPGGNLLLPLYTEYVALANDLKVRKAALGIQLGIESEAILEGATSGLYDDVALGKTGGAYTSLARALSDPNGEDAKKWAAQKEATAKDKKTGMTLAAVGAIGSAVANIAINSGDDKKEKSDTNAQQATLNLGIYNFDMEPDKCSYSECLSKLIISERTKTTPYYTNIANFCSERFPSEPDCIKILLMYTQIGYHLSYTDILLANNYNMDFFKKFSSSYCDVWGVCENEKTVLFSDDWYEYNNSVATKKKLKTDLEKCFKIAGAANYFDLPINEYDPVSVNIDFTKLDCTKLDEGKSDSDTKVRGSDVTNLLKDSQNNIWEKIQLLFGKHSNLVSISQTN